jgi:hypothetical protein
LIIVILTAFLIRYSGLIFAKGKFIPDVNSTRRLLISVVAVLAVSFSAAFVYLVFEQPTLPTVVIKGENKVKGSLLTHRDRFWYVCTKEGALVAISEDEVKTVRIAPEGN